MLTCRVFEDFEHAGEAAGLIGHLHRHDFGHLDHDAGVLEDSLGLAPSRDKIRRRMPKRCVSASVSVRMSMPALASRRHGGGHCPGLFSRKSDNCWIFMADLFAGLRRSITRCALPSLRGMLAGRTSVTCTRKPTTVRWNAACVRAASPGAPILSLKVSGVTSTCTSIWSSPWAREDDLIMRQRAFDPQQRGLDLRGEDVDAADDEHVVAAPADAPHAPQRRPHGQARHQRGDVAGAIADHRHGLLAERGQHQFAFLAIGQHRAADRIDDILASVGLYGLLSYEVARRTSEIGLRMALGARPRDVLRFLIAQGILLSSAGIVIGVAAATALTRYLASLLYQVHPLDPFTFIGVAALLLLVALFACYLPARRAMGVDPMIALRHE